jgi:hypothetical protein
MVQTQSMLAAYELSWEYRSHSPSKSPPLSHCGCWNFYVILEQMEALGFGAQEILI